MFEGQTISDFFKWWLVEGAVRNQNPAPSTFRPKATCAAIKYYLTRLEPNTFFLDGKETRFIYILLAELGSIAHLDRLTVYLARPNQKKGNVSGSNLP